MKSKMKVMMAFAILAMAAISVAQAGTLYYCDAPAVDGVGVVLPISGGPSLKSDDYASPHIIGAWEDMMTKSYLSNKAFKVYYYSEDHIIWAIQLTKRICLQ